MYEGHVRGIHSTFVGLHSCEFVLMYRHTPVHFSFCIRYIHLFGPPVRPFVLYIYPFLVGLSIRTSIFSHTEFRRYVHSFFYPFIFTSMISFLLSLFMRSFLRVHTSIPFIHIFSFICFMHSFVH